MAEGKLYYKVLKEYDGYAVNGIVDPEKLPEGTDVQALVNEGVLIEATMREVEEVGSSTTPNEVTDEETKDEAAE